MCNLNKKKKNSCHIGEFTFFKHSVIINTANTLNKYNIPESSKKIIKNLVYGSIYGSTGGTPIINTDDPVENYKRYKKNKDDLSIDVISSITNVDIMCSSFISNHNTRVGDDDIVFHVGDFGYYGYAEFLNGCHVLVMGNYEYKECAEKFDNNIEKFKEYIIFNYEFIDVIEDYMLDTTEWKGFRNIGNIYITHEPMNCLYNRKENMYILNKNNYTTMTNALSSVFLFPIAFFTKKC